MWIDVTDAALCVGSDEFEYDSDDDDYQAGITGGDDDKFWTRLANELYDLQRQRLVPAANDDDEEGREDPDE